MLIEAIVRRFPAIRALSEPTAAARLTGHLSLAVGQVEAEFAEMTRAGRRFATIWSTSGAATSTAYPTTTAPWVLYNADVNKSLIIDQVGAFILSGTPGAGLTLLGIVTAIAANAAVPAAATGATITNLSAGGQYSKAVPAGSTTIPAQLGQSQQWVVIPGQQGQCNVGTATASIGGIFTADVRGRLIVPPGKALGVATFGTTGGTFIPFASWYEAEIDLE